MDKEFVSDIADLALLDDPVRRALYQFVIGQPGDVEREQAARAVRVSRALAAFHLDRLVEAGLLEVGARHAGGRRLRGAGRPPKVYRRSARQFDVTLPKRRYELAARLMAGSIDDAPSSGAAASLRRHASALGRSLGARARRGKGARPSRAVLTAAAEDVLREHGFVPQRGEGGEVCLRSCPFDALVREHRDLVCGMNVQLIGGLIEGLRVGGVRASFEPANDRCCVVLRAKTG